MHVGTHGRLLGIVCAMVMLGAACAPPQAPGGAAKPAAGGATAAQPAAQGAAPAKPAQGTVTLRGLSPWETTISYSKPLTMLIEHVQRKTNGELVIQFNGPEVVPAFEQGTAISRGAFDISHNTPAFYSTNLPEANALFFIQGPCSNYRAGGNHPRVMELLDEVHRQKMNATVLGCSLGGQGFTFLSREPINTVEGFRGKKMRTTGLYTPILNALGSSTVEIAPAEVYTALERRVADGLGWPEAGILERKLPEVVKYWIKPTYMEVRGTLTVNLDTWNRLPPHLQKALQESVLELEPQIDAMYRSDADKEQVEMAAQGMQAITLPPAEAERYLKLVDDSVWGMIVQASPEWGPRLREAYSK